MLCSLHTQFVADHHVELRQNGHGLSNRLVEAKRTVASVHVDVWMLPSHFGGQLSQWAEQRDPGFPALPLADAPVDDLRLACARSTQSNQDARFPFAFSSQSSMSASVSASCAATDSLTVLSSRSYCVSGWSPKRSALHYHCCCRLGRPPGHCLAPRHCPGRAHQRGSAGRGMRLQTVSM